MRHCAKPRTSALAVLSSNDQALFRSKVGFTDECLPLLVCFRKVSQRSIQDLFRMTDVCPVIDHRRVAVIDVTVIRGEMSRPSLRRSSLEAIPIKLREVGSVTTGRTGCPFAHTFKRGSVTDVVILSIAYVDSKSPKPKWHPKPSESGPRIGSAKRSSNR
jgi:hypothetical protein